MTLLSSLISSFIYTSLSFSLLLFAFRIVMPYCCSQFMMKYFCGKTVHSFLGLSCSSNAILPSSKCGLGLITNETPRVPNVIESSSVVKPMAPTPPSPSLKRKDPGGIGFIDDIGGGVDGLMSCTESLGFESCDERRVDDDHDDDDGHNNDHNQQVVFSDGKKVVMMTRDEWRKKRSEEKRERNNKKFPPPLSSLNQNGQPCFYLKPVRRNGRLELTEVSIERPEIFRAVRQNGRLRLHLVSRDVCPKINEEEGEEEENEETRQEEKRQELHFQEEEEEEEKKVEDLWKSRVSGEGFRRCHELVLSHHHHHHHHDYRQHHHHHHLPNINDHHSLHVWRQPCVITR